MEDIFDLAREGETEALREALAGGVPADLRNARGDSLLMVAAYAGRHAAAALLLDRGAALDGAGPDGRTALMTAALFDRAAVVEVLLARGANRTLIDAKGQTALDMAKAMGARLTPALLAQA